LVKLKILYASDNSGIDDNGIQNLVLLEELYTNCNPKITIKLKK
jgi:hypothetical protein